MAMSNKKVIKKPMKKAQVSLRLDMLARRWLLNYRRFWLLYIYFSFLSRPKKRTRKKKARR